MLSNVLFLFEAVSRGGAVLGFDVDYVHAVEVFG
jgi:hypothetical protein